MQQCAQAPLPFKQHIVGHGITIIGEFFLGLNKAGKGDQEKYQASYLFHFRLKVKTKLRKIKRLP
jgi:hypothetical protein